MFHGMDLSSDTVTRPTEAMKKAMLAAELGDEQRGEDPTTRRLEERMCELLGHSDAMFFPSATMANQIALRLLSEPGDELIAAEHCHLFFAEGGSPAIHSGLMARPIRTENGIFTGDDVRTAYRWLQGPHYPISKIVSIENTTNMGGGCAWTESQISSVLSAANELNLSTHLDGARLFNASLSSGLSVKEIASEFDTATVCFSKGLGCPMGAVLVFDAIHRVKVRRLKQIFGGAMRQSGILAAACLYALDNHVVRLVEDHSNAQLLAVGLSDIPGIEVETFAPASNMVFFRWTAAKGSIDEFQDACLRNGVRFSRVGPRRLRAVTHLDLSKKQIEEAIRVIRSQLS